MTTSIVISSPKVRSEVAINVTKLPADGTWQVSIKKVANNRSLQQNNLYWQWMGIIAEHTGNSTEMLHMYFKRKFLGMKYVDVLDSCVEVVRDSHTLSVGEFAEYMTQVQAFAVVDLGIELPSM